MYWVRAARLRVNAADNCLPVLVGLAGLDVRGSAEILTAADTNIIRLSECFPPGTTLDRPHRQRSRFRQLCKNLSSQ
jgi:hypothetical protein